MADVVLSDVHLRLDRPQRGQRLAALVDGLPAEDRLVIAGDLCDFWFSSRQRDTDPRRCPGLRALLDFRQRGGSLRLLLGNHDAWMGSRYEQWFGLTIENQPFRWVSHGLRIELTHGHLVREKPRWKSLMEGRAFLEGFAALPGFVAQSLAGMLDASNEKTRGRSEVSMIEGYRDYCRRVSQPTDLLVFGHVHRVVDDPGPPRLIVLGDWITGTRYLRIDDQGAHHLDLPATS